MGSTLAAAGAVVGLLLALAGLVTVAAKGAKVLVRLARGLSDFLDDWRGEQGRPGVPARPGVMQRLATVESTVGQIREQMHPNGGKTLRDAVDRVEVAMTDPGRRES